MVFCWLSAPRLWAGKVFSRASFSTAAVALESLSIIPALLLLFFLPGWTLVNLLFPRKGELDREYDLLYRLTLGIVMSVVVTILYGSA